MLVSGRVAGFLPSTVSIQPPCQVEGWLNCPLRRCAGGTIAAWNHGGGLSADATGKKTQKKSRLVFHLEHLTKLTKYCMFFLNDFYVSFLNVVFIFKTGCFVSASRQMFQNVGVANP